MGKRARKGGIANAALRAARTAAMARDEEAAAIAQRVYGVAISTRAESQYPLQVYAPVQMAAELAAQGIVRAYELAPPGTDLEKAAVLEVAAYMTAGFFAMIAEFNVEHWDDWRKKASAAEKGEGDGDG